MPGAEALKETGENTIGSKPKRGRRPTKKDVSGEEFIYCLAEGTGENGLITLSKPGTKSDIELAAYKKGVHYFRLQEFVTETVVKPEGNLIIGVPVKK